jgi:hypothetical protein
MNSMSLCVLGNHVIATIESIWNLRHRFSLETFLTPARAMSELILDILQQPQMPHFYHVLKRTYPRH